MDISKKEQIITYVIYAVIIILVLAKIKDILEVFGFGDDAKDEKTTETIQNKSIAESKVKIKEATTKGVLPSYTKASYSNLADGIWYALKDFMRDREVAYSKFVALKKPIDWDYLNDAFGIRSLDGQSYNLKGFIVERMERSLSWDKSINDINEILAKNKIGQQI